ncbi:MAG: hypothetical protein WDZ83_14500 [Rhizobiaceae bacterium]
MLSAAPATAAGWSDQTSDDPHVQNAIDALEKAFEAAATRGDATVGASGTMADLLYQSDQLTCNAWVISFNRLLTRLSVEQASPELIDAAQRLKNRVEAACQDVLDPDSVAAGGGVAADGDIDDGAIAAPGWHTPSGLVGEVTWDVVDEICYRRCFGAWLRWQSATARASRADRDLKRAELRAEVLQMDFIPFKESEAAAARQELERLEGQRPPFPRADPGLEVRIGEASADAANMRQELEGARSQFEELEQQIPELEDARTEALEALKTAATALADCLRACQEFATQAGENSDFVEVMLRRLQTHIRSVEAALSRRPTQVGQADAPGAVGETTGAQRPGPDWAQKTARVGVGLPRTVGLRIDGGYAAVGGLGVSSNAALNHPVTGVNTGLLTGPNTFDGFGLSFQVESPQVDSPVFGIPDVYGKVSFTHAWGSAEAYAPVGGKHKYFSFLGPREGGCLLVNPCVNYSLLANSTDLGARIDQKITTARIAAGAYRPVDRIFSGYDTFANVPSSRSIVSRFSVGLEPGFLWVGQDIQSRVFSTVLPDFYSNTFVTTNDLFFYLMPRVRAQLPLTAFQRTFSSNPSLPPPIFSIEAGIGAALTYSDASASQTNRCDPGNFTCSTFYGTDEFSRRIGHSGFNAGLIAEIEASLDFVLTEKARLGITGNVRYLSGVTRYVAPTPGSDPARFDRTDAVAWGVGVKLSIADPFGALVDR